MSIKNSQQLKSRNIAALRSMIAKLLSSGNPAIDKVAQLGGFSVRTLQRRLHDADISYSELVEEARYAEACHLLVSTHIPLAEIAKTLGYNNHSSFSRAFKRWEAISPLDYRKSHRARSKVH